MDKDSSPSFRTVDCRVAEFKRGLEDDPMEGRPKSVSISEILRKIKDVFLKDRPLTEEDLVEALEISFVNVSDVLAQVLGLRKLCAQ